MILLQKPEYGKRINLIIIGAGEAGKMVSDYLLQNPDLNYNVTAFIDDDSTKIGQKHQDITILGPIANIKKILLENKADEILIAAPSVSGEIIKKLVNSLEDVKIGIKILPVSFETLTFLEEGKADFEQIRDLEIEDFFRRKPVITRIEEIKNYLFNKTILVTGAAGSIGSELCNQLLCFGISNLIALDNRETAIYELNLKLGEKYKERIIPVIADVRDKSKVREIIKKFHPEIIFHAAAYKHVPIMEKYPEEAIKNNVFGTKNLVELSDELGVKDFILISTDKAVNPKSIMGLTKRVGEMIIQSKAEHSLTKFVAVRFGNVINSDGSAIPLFKKQIEKGGPVTITHPEMKRFFMTIPEAVQLVINSISFGKSGDIFILDMGEQVKILEIVEEMIKLKGLKPYRDIKVNLTGLREGEKLSEELVGDGEDKLITENERIFLLKKRHYFEEKELNEKLNELNELSKGFDNNLLVPKLKETVLIGLKEENFLPYCLPQLGEEEEKEIIDTLKNNWITQGPKTIKLEEQLADYIKAKHIVCVNSCTAALHLCLVALDIKEGDEVITTPYTFTSTANVICHVGAKPVFVDVQPDTFNINPSKIEKAITPKTKAIIVVHYAGQPAEMEEIQRIADKYNLKIIEDAAHAIGAEYNSKKIGSSRNLTCFSFYATKNMTTGEGGAIALNDPVLADRLKILRLHGISKDAWKRYTKEGSWFYEVEESGWKYNMTDIQASLGIPQLKKLEQFNKKRRELAEIYNRELSKIPEIIIPVRTDINPVYHIYPILLKSYDRNKFIEEMTKRNIGTSVHFIPLHLHPFFKREYGYKQGDFPISEEIYNKEVSLPLYPKMTAEEVMRVVFAIKDILQLEKIKDLENLTLK